MNLKDSWRVFAITSLAVVVLTLSIVDSVMDASGAHDHHADGHSHSE